MTLNSVFRKKGEIVTRRIAGETLLVPIRSRVADMQKLFTLNTTAEYIWQQLDGTRSLEEILHGLTADFEVEKDEAEADMREFILELEEAGIIEEAN